MNTTERRNKISLTIYYSAIIFITLAVALVLISTVAYLLVKFGVIGEFKEMTNDVSKLIWVVAGGSLTLGAAISFLTSKLTLMLLVLTSPLMVRSPL